MTTTSTTPTPRPTGLTAEQVAASRSLIERALAEATDIVNRRMVTAPDDIPWSMTHRQRSAISAPWARMLARRSPAAEPTASDVADAVEGVVRLMAFAMEQITEPGPDCLS